MQARRAREFCCRAPLSTAASGLLRRRSVQLPSAKTGPSFVSQNHRDKVDQTASKDLGDGKDSESLDIHVRARPPGICPAEQRRRRHLSGPAAESD